MKTLLEIFSSIFQKCENEKTSLSDEFTQLHHAAEEYIEELQKHDRWENIIKMDIDYLKASSQMRQNYIKTAKVVDNATKSAVARYSSEIETFLFFIYCEMERWGLAIKNFPEIPKEFIELFPTEAQCKKFVNENYGKRPQIVAYNYKEEKGVVDPKENSKGIPVIAILYKYLVKPFDEKEGARTNFYNYFK